MEHQIADLHCHYPMHVLAEESGGDPFVKPLKEFERRRLWHRIRTTLVRWAARRVNFGKSGKWRVNLDHLDAGGVRLVFSVLYVPETEFGVEEWVTGHPGEDSFEELGEHLDVVTRRIEDRAGGPAAIVVTRASQLQGAGRDGTIRFVHCVEGGTHLGPDPDGVEKRVMALAEKGVAYVTLAHLFYRHVATNAPALPRLSDRSYDFLFAQPKGVGLTELGRAAVRAMYRYGVLIDVSHMRQPAIDETFDLLEELDEETGHAPTAYPVLATHAGWRFSEKHSYMLSPGTVDRIAARDGVVGLIMAHHLLNDDRGRPGDIEKTMRSVNSHIAELHGRTGSFRHIGLGTDLDGFIKPTVGGIETAADMATLAARLVENHSEEDARAMLHGNALRTLEAAYARRAEVGIGRG